jgi:hypothetical protein
MEVASRVAPTIFSGQPDKRVTRVAYEERFGLTTKQKARIDQWEKGETVNNATDVTTEEEPDYFFDSD